MKIGILPSWFSNPEKPFCAEYFISHAKALELAGCEPVFLVFEPRTLRRFHPKHFGANHFQVTDQVERGLRVIRLHGWQFFGFSPFAGDYWAWAGGRILRHAQRQGLRLDILYGQSGIWGGYVAHRLNQASGIPYAVTEHRSYLMPGSTALKPGHLARYKRTREQAAAFSAVSRALAEEIERRFPGPPVELIPNCIDLDLWRVNPEPRKRQFACIGNLVPVKGVDVLVEAFARFHPIRPDWRLLIVGNGVSRAELEGRVLALGLSAHVEFTGAVPPERVQAIMQESAALISPSRTETFGLVVVEALATGTPVIATRSGGPNDILDASCGRLIPTQDPEAMAGAMAELASEAVHFDPAVCRRRAESYGLHEVGRKLRAHLETAITSPCAP